MFSSQFAWKLDIHRRITWTLDTNAGQIVLRRRGKYGPFYAYINGKPLSTPPNDNVDVLRKYVEELLLGGIAHGV